MKSVPENTQPPTDLLPQCRWGTERPTADSLQGGVAGQQPQRHRRMAHAVVQH